VLETATTEEWLKAFGGKVPAAPVHDIKGALDAPFVRDGGRIVTLPHPSGHDVGTVGPAIRESGVQPPVRPAPAMGADTEAVLRDLGYDPKRIAVLREAGAV